MRSFVKQSILKIAKKSSTITNLAAFITRNNTKDNYEYLRDRFIKNGQSHAINSMVRKNLISKFESIDQEVQIGSTPTDGLFLAEMLLNMQGEGDIVECGCYAGGSSAKLSILANLLGRKLYIFDSFEGLPIVEEYFLRDQHCRRSDEWVADWSEGRYAARIDEVKSNIKKYGDISVCTLIKGWFNESLTIKNLPSKIGFAFVDVDLANSARECFIPIWPNLTNKGIYVTHDTSYIKVLQELYKPELWQNHFKATPPILFGAGFGLSNESPHIGYMVKGESLSSEYLKSLTIDK